MWTVAVPGAISLDVDTRPPKESTESPEENIRRGRRGRDAH